jgi:hypothetical protein
MKKFALALCLSLLASPAAAFVLDSVSNVKAAYSVRQLKTGVTSAMTFVCVDTTPVAAGWSGGFVDLNACAGHSGISTISVIKDQSGNGFDLLLSAGTGTSCTITASGIASKPSINFTASCLYSNVNVSQTASYTVLGVVQASGTTSPQLIFTSDFVGTLRMGHYLRYDGSTGSAPANELNFIAFDSTSPNGNAFQVKTLTTVTNPHTISVMLNGTAMSTWIDKVAGSTGTLGGTGIGASGSTELDLGGDRTNASSFLGLWSEAILIAAAAPTDRTNIENDQWTTFFTTGGVPSSRTLMGVGK